VITVQRHAGKVPVEEVAALVERETAPDGESPLSEGKWLDLVHGGRDGFVALLAREPGGPLVGYAQATRGPKGWGLEVVVDRDVDRILDDAASRGDHPDGRPAAALRREMVAAALDELRSGGGRVHYWVTRPPPGSDEALAGLGLTPDRDQLQMRVDLPLASSATTGPAITVRPFVPGEDEAAWLAVNNRAFAGHAEQGGWDLRTLQDRMAEPWFDPAGFLLHEIGGRLAGSCWTKVHRETTPPMGEIYVISVDPDFHGRGLGRALTVAGLDWLARAGLTTGTLYVAASNAPAVDLYRSLGFTVHRLDRVYTNDPVATG
jgi:mycothiol synthase